MGLGETNDPLSRSIASVSQQGANINIDAYTNLHTNLRSRAGDGGTTQFAIHFRARNANTNAVAFTSSRLVRITSSNQNLFRYLNRSISGLSPKTPYVFEVYSSSGGLENIPLLRRCFMTGGTYTSTNTDILNGSTGCFTITPRTPQDVRNCLCGRGNTGTVVGRRRTTIRHSVPPGAAPADLPNTAGRRHRRPSSRQTITAVMVPVRPDTAPSSFVAGGPCAAFPDSHSH